MPERIPNPLKDKLISTESLTGTWPVMGLMVNYYL